VELRLSGALNPHTAALLYRHELGHWHHHAVSLFAVVLMTFYQPRGPRPTEGPEADRYFPLTPDAGAAFLPVISRSRRPCVRSMTCAVSLRLRLQPISVALRLIDVIPCPRLLTCYDRRGLKWFRFSTDVPRRWYLKDVLDEDSFAIRALHIGKGATGLAKVKRRYMVPSMPTVTTTSSREHSG